MVRGHDFCPGNPRGNSSGGVQEDDDEIVEMYNAVHTTQFDRDSGVVYDK